jgi:sulfur-carrier protein
MTTIGLQFWAGAKAAAGVAREEWNADSVAEALDRAREARSDPNFDRVVAVCSVLIDGRVAGARDLAARRSEPLVAEILPPFAGG